MVRDARARSSGMTLVEIMITLIISSIIAASTFMFFAGQQRIYETQTKLLNIQQNLWAAMEVVARYTRAAGGGMYECVRPASYYNANSDNGLRLRSTVPSDGPLTTSLAARPQTGLRAYDATPSVNAMQWIPPLWIVNNSTSDAGVVPGTDILTVGFGNRTSGTDTDVQLGGSFASTSSATLIQLPATMLNVGNMFRQWEFVLLLNPPWSYHSDPRLDRGCTMFQITSDPTSGTTLAHASGAVKPGSSISWNPGGDEANMLPSGGYAAGSAGVRNFGELTWVTFFIQTGPNGIPNLMMQTRHLGVPANQAQILAEGIEDLQVSFACDTGFRGMYDLTALNGSLDEGTNDTERQTDEWWNNVPGDNLPPIDSDGFCNLPTAVRLTLVVRTLSQDDLIDTAVTQNGPIDVEDHRYNSPRPSDKYRRRVLTTTVYPRNNRPL